MGADITSVLRDQRLTGPLSLHLLHHGIHFMNLVLLRFYTYLCLFDSTFFFLNHAAVDVLALLSFFFVVFLSVFLFSFLCKCLTFLGHRKHIILILSIVMYFSYGKIPNYLFVDLLVEISFTGLPLFL